MIISEIKQNATIVGLEQETLVTIQAVAPINESSVTVFYTLSDGTVKSRLISASDAENLSLAEKELPYSFDGNAQEFKLALEAMLYLSMLLKFGVLSHTDYTGQSQ